jgi:hypothetical protein
MTPVLLRFRLISVGFAIGAVVHCAELCARLLGASPPAYPLWRHALFIGIDTALAVLAPLAPRRLWLPLAALLLQQSFTHGRVAWSTWQHGHRLAWVDALVVLFLGLSTLAATDFRWRRRTARARDAGSVVAAG